MVTGGVVEVDRHAPKQRGGIIRQCPAQRGWKQDADHLLICPAALQLSREQDRCGESLEEAHAGVSRVGHQQAEWMEVGAAHERPIERSKILAAIFKS